MHVVFPFVRKEIARHWMRDPVNHNSNLVIIRKREARAQPSDSQ